MTFQEPHNEPPPIFVTIGDACFVRCAIWCFFIPPDFYPSRA